MSQKGMRHNPITEYSDRYPLPSRDLWPHDPINGMSPKDSLAKVISIPHSFLGWVGPREITHKLDFPKSTIDKGA